MKPRRVGARVEAGLGSAFEVVCVGYICAWIVAIVVLEREADIYTHRQVKQAVLVDAYTLISHAIQPSASFTSMDLVGCTYMYREDF